MNTGASPSTASAALALPAGLSALLDAVARQAKASGVFGAVSVSPARLEAAAKASAEPAFYRVSFEDGGLWVTLVTAARYLSQSIEADLVHTGDKLHELVTEELIVSGYDGACAAVEHFRSDDKLFTFRARLPIDPPAGAGPEHAGLVTTWLLAFESAFRPLGDMEADDAE